MAQKTGKIHIKWVRSGIGFPRRQKDTVKSLGLRRLNQVVERPDTAHIRGLIAKVPHLVAVVDPPASPSWASLPEYKIVAAQAAPAIEPPKEKAGKETAAEAHAKEAPAVSEKAEAAEAAPQEETAAEAQEAAAPKAVSAAPRKRARATKSSPSEAGEEASAGTEKKKRRRKAAEPKPEAEE